MKSLLILILLLFSGGHSPSAVKTVSMETAASINNDPVFIDLEPGTLDAHAPVCLIKVGGTRTPGQIEIRDDGTQRLWWIAEVPANHSVSYDVITGQNCNEGSGFYWKRVRDDATLLMNGGKPAIQYEHPVFDFENNDATRKPYHHVFDPAGKGLITKGVGGTHTHHRGIFLGYYLHTGDDRKEKARNNIDRINIWAPSEGERSEHHRIVKEFAGPVMGGHILEILWTDKDGSTLIKEIREIRVFSQPRGEVLIDFTSHLSPAAGPVKLWGDAHHGGVHYRAAQYVADNPESTFFIRPEHWSHLSPEQENQGRRNPENLHVTPWNAMVYQIGDRKYTAAQLTHPDNPVNDEEMGERKYGRIGYYFPHDLTGENPLNLNYRFWITTGQAPQRAEIDGKYRTYSSPPVLSVSN